MRIGLLGKKIGMTRVYDDKRARHRRHGHRRRRQQPAPGQDRRNDGYSAIQVGFDTQKESRVPKAELGHFKKAGSEPKRFVREFRLEDNETPAARLRPYVTLFKPGQLVDVIGHSKGKGFQGVMRKHNIDGQGASPTVP